MNTKENLKYICPRCHHRLMMVKRECHYEEGHLINAHTGKMNKAKFKTDVYETFQIPPVYIKCIYCGLSTQGCDYGNPEYQKKIDDLLIKIAEKIE